MMPHGFPGWSTCYDDSYKWRNDGTWAKTNDAMRTGVRRCADREKCPSVGIVDSQSVKATEQGGPDGKDAFKKANGRKRHLVVDTLGLVVAAVVHSAGIQDRDCARLVLKKLVGRFPRLKKILADGIYNEGIAEWAKEAGGWIWESIVRDPNEPEEKKGFKVLKWRWIVERTFTWLGRYHRMSKDYERTAVSSKSWIYLGMIHLMLQRLDPAYTSRQEAIYPTTLLAPMNPGVHAARRVCDRAYAVTLSPCQVC